MSTSPTIKLLMPEEDIALLQLDMPGKGVNVLSQSVLEELSQHLDQLQGRNDLAGLVIASGKPATFIAGADVREFVASMDLPREQVVAMCRKGQTLFGRLASCPFVTVAAIDGVCLGGGAEVAIWCDRRVMSQHEKTAFGFPEVQLGLFPGWGGTVRAPRMVGLANALELITGGESISANEAMAMGLAQDVVPSERLLEAAIEMIRAENQTGDYLRDRQQWSAAVAIDEVEMGFLGITASAYIQQQTKGHYPAPLAALESMMESAGCDAQTACQLEAEHMSSLFGSPVNAALLNVFFLNERIKKDRGIEDDSIHPRSIDSVAVIGAGIMGSGIAAASVKRGLACVLSDAAEKAVHQGAQQVLEEISYNRQSKSADVQRAIQLAPLLNIASPAAGDAEIATCDLIIEAIVESREVKKKIYRRLEPHLQEHTILASNTSTIPITQLADGLQHPERFCGIHFFNPVRRMKLVEVIRGQQTSDETVATAVAYAKRVGKMPIVVNDGPGFLVNRLLFPYMQEAVELLCDGVEIKQIERAAKSFGMPMGPIELFDMVGLDTAIYAGLNMVEAFPDRFIASPVLPALVRNGRLGRKSGAGFYSYANPEKKLTPDPQLGALIEPYQRDKIDISPEQLTHRLFLPMLLEATRVLEANVVRSVRDVDFGLIFGLGFPPFKGGLLRWADTLGAAKILEIIKPLQSLGKRMNPPELLSELADEGRTFYDLDHSKTNS